MQQHTWGLVCQSLGRRCQCFKFRVPVGSPFRILLRQQSALLLEDTVGLGFPYYGLTFCRSVTTGEGVIR